MSEYYVLRDVDNRGDDGEPWEVRSWTLSGFVSYVDGPLRGDVAGIAAYKVDRAIEALNREDFPTAESLLRELGVYLRLEVGDIDE